MLPAKEPPYSQTKKTSYLSQKNSLADSLLIKSNRPWRSILDSSSKNILWLLWLAELSKSMDLCLRQKQNREIAFKAMNICVAKPHWFCHRIELLWLDHHPISSKECHKKELRETTKRHKWLLLQGVVVSLVSFRKKMPLFKKAGHHFHLLNPHHWLTYPIRRVDQHLRQV